MTDYTKPVDIGPGYATLKEAMIAEGIYQIRYYQSSEQFSVQLVGGPQSAGVGATPREAITDAKEQVA